MLLNARSKMALGRVLFDKLGFKHQQKKNQRSKFYREFWSQAAVEVGASVQELEGGFILVRRGNSVATFLDNYTDLDGPATLRLAGDKLLTKQLLASNDISTPKSLAFTLNSLDESLDFLRHHSPCVVKPAKGSSAGQGVCTHIQTLGQLRRSACYAAAFSKQLIIEEQLCGDDLRFLFLDGTLLDVVHRKPPTLIGDGRSSIARLVEANNQSRLAAGVNVAQVLVSKSPEVISTLASQGYTMRSIPKAGDCVKVKTVVNDNSAEDNVSVFEKVSDGLVEMARRAAGVLNVRLAGVDVLTRSSECSIADLDASQAAILEVNTTPGLYIHRNTQTCNIGGLIIDACLSRSSAYSMYVSKAGF